MRSLVRLSSVAETHLTGRTVVLQLTPETRSVVPDGPKNAGDMRAMPSVSGVVVHRVTRRVTDSVAVRPGSASTDAARICPNVACQVGVCVIHPRVGLRDDDRISGRENSTGARGERGRRFRKGGTILSGGHVYVDGLQIACCGR